MDMTNEDFVLSMSGESYILVHRTLLATLGDRCSILLGELLAKYRLWKLRGKLVDEVWFYQTNQYFEKMLHISTPTLIKYMNKLEEWGLIKTAARQGYSQKYYAIEFDAIADVLRSGKPFPTRVKKFKGGVKKFNPKKEVIKKEVSKSHSSPFGLRPLQRSEYRDNPSDLAALLHHTSNTIGRGNKRSKEHQTVHHLKMMRSKDKIPRKRITKVLRWYVHHLEQGRNKFTPEAYCGRTFREKFERIEAAMERLAADNTTSEFYTMHRHTYRHPSGSWSSYPKRVDLSAVWMLVPEIQGYAEECAETYYQFRWAFWHWVNCLEDSYTPTGNKAAVERYENVIRNSDTLDRHINSWIARRLKGWDGWIKDFRCFAPGSKMFRQWVDDLCAEHRLSLDGLQEQITTSTQETIAWMETHRV